MKSKIKKMFLPTPFFVFLAAVVLGLGLAKTPRVQADSSCSCMTPSGTTNLPNQASGDACAEACQKAVGGTDVPVVTTFNGQVYKNSNGTLGAPSVQMPQTTASPGIGTTATASPGVGTTKQPTSSAIAGQSGGIVPCGSGNTVGGACTLCHLIIGINNLIKYGLGILITISVVAIFIAGIIYIISSGTPLMEQAKKALSAALVGFTLVLTAWLIVATVMWILSAQSDLGIGKTGSNWQTASISYTCSTVNSAAGTAPGTSGLTDAQAQTNCKNYWNSYYASDPNNPDLQTQLTNCNSVTAAQQNANTTAAQQAQNQTDCNNYCNAGGDGTTDAATCNTNCMAAKSAQQAGTASGQAGTGSSSAVNAASQMMSNGCQYDQSQRNGCTGNPGYTDCSNFVCTSYKNAGCTCPGNVSGDYANIAQPITDSSTLQPGDVLSVPGHVVMCQNVGCTTVIGASGVKDGIKQSNGSYYLNQGAQVVKASSYCPSN